MGEGGRKAGTRFPIWFSQEKLSALLLLPGPSPAAPLGLAAGAPARQPKASLARRVPLQDLGQDLLGIWEELALLQQTLPIPSAVLQELRWQDLWQDLLGVGQHLLGAYLAQEGSGFADPGNLEGFLGR